ncbi:transposase [Prolixibacteraceae bacterium Z1-6]|uniref:Transposase n=1 Tax=Draconibacterium aestuarii TaxID=2998507 RepID=A0A9X3F9X0_9BACT|nr:transposase [Prolixibacteraceae bacterium Z1-6]
MFNKESKLEAVLLSYLRNNVDEVASDLKIDSAQLYRWRKAYGDSDRIRFFTQNKLDQDDLEYQNARLRILIQDAENERDMLRQLIDSMSEDGYSPENK